VELLRILNKVNGVKSNVKFMDHSSRFKEFLNNIFISVV